MSNFGNMVRRIRTDVNRGAAHDTRIKEAICDAIAHYRAKRLGFNQKRSYTTLLSAQEFLALPSDWIEVDHLRLSEDDDRRRLREVTYDWIEDEQVGRPSTGQPTHFAIHARQLRFYPVPDRTYSLVLSFLCRLDQVSVSASDGATNGWMTEAEQLVRTYATGDLFVTYIGGDEVQRGAALLTYAEETLLPTMERQVAREETSGRLRPFL